MEERKDTDKLFGNLALGLLVVALLVPFIIAAFASEALALGFGVVAALLALVFGIIGWQQKAGKVTVITIACLSVFALGIGVLNMKKMSEARGAMEAARRQHVERRAEQNAAPLPSEGAPSDER